MSSALDSALSTINALTPLFIGMISRLHPDVQVDQLKGMVATTASNIRTDVQDWQAAHPTTPRPTL